FILVLVINIILQKPSSQYLFFHFLIQSSVISQTEIEFVIEGEQQSVIRHSLSTCGSQIRNPGHYIKNRKLIRKRKPNVSHSSCPKAKAHHSVFSEMITVIFQIHFIKHRINFFNSDKFTDGTDNAVHPNAIP